MQVNDASVQERKQLLALLVITELDHKGSI